MNNPVSTYRIQFHKDFTFSDFEKIIPYLIKLGVGTIYASPIFEATPGSVHGYDGVNPHKINPEIGTEEQLLSISQRLKEAGIKWLQDIVPNHMAFDPNNPWLKDVLEKGQKSVYASFFDVPWTGKIYHGKIMIPFLGNPLQEVIKNGELTIDFEEPRFVLKYYDSTYPLRLRSYITILQTGDGEPNQAIQQLLDQVKDIQRSEEPEAYKETLHEFQLQLSALTKSNTTKGYLESCLQKINEDHELIKQIADEQVYQLVNWQKTDQKINFRRFFTVNGLICLNMQDNDVFLYYHKYIKELLDKGVFQGLRIDHIDGLFDPTLYLQQLRELAGEETYIVVEKILEPGEGLPDYWPIEGNTGYDFLGIVNNAFTNKTSEKQFTEYYEDLVKDDRSIHQQLHDKKSYILHENMGGELSNLHHLFEDMNLVEDNELSNVAPEVLKEAIGEFLIQCPVYRYYGNKLPLDQTEAGDVQDILNRIKQNKPELAPAIPLLETALLHKPKEGDKAYNARALRFYQRCMQFTGPLMAKGAEDTLMYTYNRFIGHNEVGDSPDAFGDSPEEFHQKMLDRQEKWRLSMNGTSTHDTKRGEDVRARLNVLTDLPDEWFAVVKEWQELNKELKEQEAPDANDEYLIYQTLVGAYPMPTQGDDDFKNRVQEYLQKALREAKTHSNWTTPNEEYETAAKNFAVNLLQQNKPFWKRFEQFHKKVSDFGVVNSLAQVVVKFTAPGVPDVYQGTELWDFSLVDPDNRRPVDYELRQQLMNELEAQANDEHENLMSHLWENRYSAKIKLWLTHQLLNDRKENKEFFEKAEYIPLTVLGEFASNVLAYARRYQNEWYVVAVPLHLAALSKEQQQEILSIDWKDTRVALPAGAPATYQHLFSKVNRTHEQEITIKDIFKSLPLAVLKLK
ncbi:malto-oligosyltrehalose synthase [Segetibacter aerophilus]|uniref:Malto-oligosyltrehalose synthase n=1 Tax=Segetibacter aerophilus TaxID=670293 RepID=A0A512BB15_9BACT|nr:malto-oligosyltrehalose synthase [Segetibacter aerophilus]GEO09174.1 malto-oligosyltrehalose synthase [Segetibacter aerophilus]